MTRTDRWRQLLVLIRDNFCSGNQAELARRIDKDGNYVNRLFWPHDKKGAKGIGPEVTDSCKTAFGLPDGFWDMTPEQAREALEGGEVAARSIPFEFWKEHASPRSREVIDQLQMLAQKNTLGDEDWELISQLALRFQSKAKKK